MKRPGNDLVSIVTPAFNAARFVGESIASAKAQTYGDWEMLVVDDGSTDDTADQVRRATAADSRIRLIRFDTNRGIAAARNVALEQARGRYVAFLDSDDLWDATKLERQIAFMRESHARFVYAGYRLISEQGGNLGQVQVEAATVNYRQMLAGFRTQCVTVVLERSILEGRRFPPFAKASDLALWLELLRAGHLGHGLSEVLASYRVVRGSVSRNKMKYVAKVWDIYRAQPIARATAGWYYAQYALRGVIKHMTSGAYRANPS